MKVLIVEDEQLAAERLEEMIHSYDRSIAIEGPLDTVQDTVRYLREHRDIDILFLDIQLADGKSFELFEQVACETPVVFTTAYDQYSLKAFKYNSIDYLLKPVRFDDLQQALEKFKRLNPAERPAPLSKELVQELLASLQSPYKQRFLVRQGNKILYVPVEDIAYLFAEGKIAYLVTKETQRQYIVDHTLEELESHLLDPARFFRISRKHIVHIQAIKEVQTQPQRLEVKIAQPCDPPLWVSREKITEFKRWLNR
ncbi:MAG: LytTR family DNA-binding domain-containing protein [Cyclobacteriaceae bacterium]|jgi:DNA-binding LytR/AlgR family response regulator|nr:LytTR family DNA-binding domain-containing protein [Cyclobacteriaceae bacterium]